MLDEPLLEPGDLSEVHALVGGGGDGSGQVHDKAGVHADLQVGTLRSPGFLDSPALLKHPLFAAVADHVHPGIAGVEVRHHVVWEQVAFEVGGGQNRGGCLVQLFCESVGL